MLKTPEQYLSELDFDPPVPDESSPPLSSGERAFVEKYLGMDILREFSGSAPAPQPQPQKIIVAASRPVMEPRLEIAPPRLQVAPEKTPAKDTQALQLPVAIATTAEIAAQPAETPARESLKPAATEKPAALAAPEKTVAGEIITREEAAASPVIAEKTGQKTETIAPPAIAESVVASQTAATISQKTQINEETAAAETTKIKTGAPHAETARTIPETTAAAAPVAASAVEAGAQAAEKTEAVITLRDIVKTEESVRMVSFFVEGQLFLLPVAGIQEVLRHMELIKVPQAPGFVAGAINIRGAVTPLIHLSALLTNRTEYAYNERSFIIVYGTERLRLGLIIDKINSMHMLERDRIIWNVESRLGDAGDFLCAIANLDERVCGIVAPEIIIQKMLTP